MKLTRSKTFQTFWGPIWANNPVAVQVLGICSSLAVTVQLKTAIVMGLALTFVTSVSNLIISVFRKNIPGNIRIIVELTVIATLVIIIDQVLRAFMYDVSKQLSVFVGLIITNCIIMGRAEAFALGNPPLVSFLDGLGNGLGYATILITVAFFRELLGAGKLLGFQVVPAAAYDLGWTNMGLMSLAPGAFIIIGMLAWVKNIYTKQKP